VPAVPLFGPSDATGSALSSEGTFCAVLGSGASVGNVNTAFCAIRLNGLMLEPSAFTVVRDEDKPVAGACGTGSGIAKA
jgi:hypothetical protein